MFTCIFRERAPLSADTFRRPKSKTQLKIELTLLSSLGLNPAESKMSTQGSWFIAAAIISGVMPSFRANDGRSKCGFRSKLFKSMDKTLEYPQRAAKNIAEVPS